MKEKISIIIPSYNNKSFLAQAVHSALQQSETGEVIIVDDASTDGSLELVLSLAAKDHRVRLIRQSPNAGAGAARNRGIEVAAFPWISFLDADDYFLPNRFQALFHTFSLDPNLDGGYDAVIHHFEDPGLAAADLLNIGEATADIRSFHSIPPEQLFSALLFQPRFWIPMVGLTVRKSFLDQHQIRFDPSLRYTEDTDFIYRCVLKGRFSGSGASQAMIVRRIHSHNSVRDHPTVWRQQRAAFFQKWRQEILYHDWPAAINHYFVKSWLQHHPLVQPVLHLAFLRYSFKAILLTALLIRYPSLIRKCSFSQIQPYKGH